MTESATLRPDRWALALPGVYLLIVTAALIAVGLVVGTEQNPFLPGSIVYRLPFAQLEPIYYVAVLGLAAHYVAYRLRVKNAPVAADTFAGPFRFSAAKFLVTWLFLVGLFGTYALGAAIATPTLFDPVLGDSRLTAGFRIWLHQYFALLLIVGLAGGLAYYSTISILQRRKLSDVFRWVPAFLNLRKGHRFIGGLNWLLFAAVLSNLTTGFTHSGCFPPDRISGAPLPALRCGEHREDYS